MRPMFGIKPKIMTDEGSKGGEGPLCIQEPWPGMAISIWGSPQRFKETYFTAFPGYYFTGDGAICNERGFWKITGRVDDVINVTGKLKMAVG
jgi:acetyl-CoA synthetase